MTGKMLVIIILGIALAVVVVNKFLRFREGLDNAADPCTGKAKGCYQFQAAGNLVPARTDTAPGGGWTEESCMNTRLLASGKWCGGATTTTAAPIDKDCCQKWVQTTGCRGDGPLDTGSSFKQTSTGGGKCSTSIPSGASGYCWRIVLLRYQRYGQRRC